MKKNTSNHNQYRMKATVWLYSGMSAWHFISLPKKQSTEIKNRFGKNAKGWGSLPVVVTIGKTSWRTSIFPDKKSGTYVLPLKADVRKKEGIYVDDSVTFSIEIR